MRVILAVGLVAILSACNTPATPRLTSETTSQPGLAVQAVSAQQTASAIGAQATQAAARVEQAQAAIEQATANAQATRDGLSLVATQTTSAIQLAQLQDAATVQAQATQAAQTQTADARIIADGQERARATATAEAIVRNAKNAADWESTIDLIRGALVIFAYAGGLTAVIVIAIVIHSTLTQLRDISLDYFRAQADMKQAEADKARIIWRIVEERGKRQEIGWYTPPNGGTPYPLLPEAREVKQETTDDDKRAEAWKIAVSRFATFAGDGPFTYDRLGPRSSRSKPGDGMGIVGRTNWDLLTEYMIRNGWLRSGGEGSKTDWAEGWGKERFFREVMHGDKGLPPFPDNGKPPPTVVTPSAQFTV